MPSPFRLFVFGGAISRVLSFYLVLLSLNLSVRSSGVQAAAVAASSPKCVTVSSGILSSSFRTKTNSKISHH